MILAKVRRKSSNNRMKTRSSHLMCSLREGVLRNFAKFTGKHLCQSLQAEACNFIKKETLAQVFSFEFCEFSKNTFFTITSENWNSHTMYYWIEGIVSKSKQYIITTSRIVMKNKRHWTNFSIAVTSSFYPTTVV